MTVSDSGAFSDPLDSSQLIFLTLSKSANLVFTDTSGGIASFEAILDNVSVTICGGVSLKMEAAMFASH